MIKFPGALTQKVSGSYIYIYIDIYIYICIHTCRYTPKPVSQTPDSKGLEAPMWCPAESGNCEIALVGAPAKRVVHVEEGRKTLVALPIPCVILTETPSSNSSLQEVVRANAV